VHTGLHTREVQRYLRPPTALSDAVHALNLTTEATFVAPRPSQYSMALRLCSVD
jgi:hypothetical protein